MSDATTTSREIDPESVRGAAADGLGGGVETGRQYLSEDFPSGSQRTVERWLKTLIGRDDVLRVWFKPMGSKKTVWHHDGPLLVMPEIDHLFDLGDLELDEAEAELAIAV